MGAIVYAPGDGGRYNHDRVTSPKLFP